LACAPEIDRKRPEILTEIDAEPSDRHQTGRQPARSFSGSALPVISMPFPTLHTALRRALDEQGYAEPTPVQAAVLAVADDRDLLVSAQTGSGKTVAFGLALAKTLMGEADRFGAPAPTSWPASAAWTRAARPAPWRPAATWWSPPPAG
jgi:superfamily II DNA/RNA helicase